MKARTLSWAMAKAQAEEGSKFGDVAGRCWEGIGQIVRSTFSVCVCGGCAEKRPTHQAQQPDIAAEASSSGSMAAVDREAEPHAGPLGVGLAEASCAR